jgi:hypothetical protein
MVNKTTPAKKKKTAATPKPPTAVMTVRPLSPGSANASPNAAVARRASSVEQRPAESTPRSSPKLLPRRD